MILILAPVALATPDLEAASPITQEHRAYAPGVAAGFGRSARLLVTVRTPEEEQLRQGIAFGLARYVGRCRGPLRPGRWRPDPAVRCASYGLVVGGFSDLRVAGPAYLSIGTYLDILGMIRELGDRGVPHVDIDRYSFLVGSAELKTSAGLHVSKAARVEAGLWLRGHVLVHRPFEDDPTYVLDLLQPGVQVTIGR